MSDQRLTLTDVLDRADSLHRLLDLYRRPDGIFALGREVERLDLHQLRRDLFTAVAVLAFSEEPRDAG